MEQQNEFAELYGTDEFRMYCFKILPCSKRVPHNWQQCAFAHWGEKARRRDLRIHSYSSQLCPDAKRESGCQRGDACPMSHNIFEAWLHPELYRTQLCTSGSSCNRTVCFFAHSQAELRQPSQPSQVPQTSDPKTPASIQQQQENVLLCSSTAAAAGGISTMTSVPSMFWTNNSMLPLASWDSTVQQQLTFGGFDALEYVPAVSSVCMLGCNSVDSLCLGGTGSSISGWSSSSSSSSSSIACGSPTASAPTNRSIGCNLLGDRLTASAEMLAAAASRSSSGGSNSARSSGAHLALALQQLKFVPDTPAVVVSDPALPNALTAGMTFSNSFNTGCPAQQLFDINGSPVGLAGDLQLLLPSAAAAAANALLLQQQREHLQKQQLLLAQQEQMLQQELQFMNLGLGAQQMMLIPR